jgi:uncharacterized protein (DUF1501 family)
MKRRIFLKSMASAATLSAFSSVSSRVWAAPDDYEGRFLVVMQMDGGWDVTQLCDPKTNTPGEPDINNWANSSDIQTAGRIHYAPVASNQRLFESHHQKMLVINGVDAQTNSHTTGVLHNWSGRNAAGLPTLTALFAAAKAPDLPLAYINNGGFSATADLIRFSRLNDHNALIDILDPALVPEDSSRTLRRTADISRVQRYQREVLERKLADNALTPRQRANATAHLSALTNRETLNRLKSIIPDSDEIQPNVVIPYVNFESDLMRQIQLSLLTFKAGVGASCDLMCHGFDTHNEHDVQHEALYNHAADAIDYFWNFAGELGISDRITLVIGSDFSRTNYYNAENGKDHWPIGSYIVMEEAPTWGNRVVGITDGLHNALQINPITLKEDSDSGITLYPKHVHKALRGYLGLDALAQEQRLTFGATEDIDLFNPEKWTT